MSRVDRAIAPAPSRRMRAASSVGVTLALLAALLGGSVPLAASAVGVGSVSGVATAEGVPVAGATISVFGPNGYRSAITDAVGAYSIVGLDEGAFSFSAYASPLYQNQGLSTVTVTASQPAVIRDVIFVPIPTGTAEVRGIVVDAATNAPIAGASVGIYGPNAPYFANAQTDALGAFIFAGVPADTYVVSTFVTGYVFDDREVLVADGASTDLSIGLVATNSAISGIVRHKDGSPFPNVDVIALNELGIGGSATSDQTGAYTISGLGPDTYTVSVGGIGTPWVSKSKSRTTTANETAIANFTTEPRTTGSINGFILTTDQFSIQNICVAAIKVGSGQVVAEDLSTLEGTYNLPDLKPGTYKLRFTDCDSTRSPKFAKAFWEDATKRVNATILTVVAADDIFLNEMTMVPKS